MSQITYKQAAAACNLAYHNQGTNDSANLCWSDAVAQLEKGEYTNAYWRAMESLKHSVGVFGAAYKAAVKLLDEPVFLGHDAEGLAAYKLPFTL